MNYEVKPDNLIISYDKFDINKNNLIAVFNTDEYNKISDKYSELKIYRRNKAYNCTQIEIHSDYIYVAFSIPTRDISKKKNVFDCIMFKNRIIFVDDSCYVEKIIELLFDTGNKKNYSLGKFFCEFISHLILKDLTFLEEIEGKLSKIENIVINHNFDKFNSKLAQVKKSLLVYYRYYSQLLALCDNIKATESDFFNKDTIRLISLFSQRVERLKTETELLREYSIQIQDMYQTEVSVRQNDIMKVLTIVTTIFLPLSLLTSWYGMNFKYMPELETKYGYYVIMLVSIIIVVISVAIFKKKKYF